jgi:Phage integrase, N-terminal SAM-like domain
MMLEELQRRNYADRTIRRYLRFVERFAQHFGKSPDKLGPDHLRSYQAYLLRERKLCREPLRTMWPRGRPSKWPTSSVAGAGSFWSASRPFSAINS